MMNAQENTDSIYRLLIHKKFRSGPKPTEWQEEKIKQKIKSRVEDNLPVHLFQFWGGCKNPNLESPNADICEWHTLNQLSKINEAVQSVYSPGLHITLFPGDERVHRVNHIPMEITTNYVKGLKQISNQFGNLFDVVAVSDLYNKYNKELNNAIQATELLITENIFTNPSFQLFVSSSNKCNFLL
jgi:pyoverdine/dityrosine biosynthesis protein Dit1